MSEKLLAFQISGSHFKKWDSDNNAINSSKIDENSMDECLDTIVQKLKSNPNDQVKIAISTASDVDKDLVLTANNFPIGEQKRGRDSRFELKTELEKKLHEAQIDKPNMELTVENDAELQLKDAALKFQLEKKARALAVSIGTGFNLKDGINYKGNGEFEELKSGSRIQIPDLDKYQDLEGPARSYSSSDSKGSAAAYISGGHEEDLTHGPRGTANHLFQLLESSNKDDTQQLKRALKILIPNKGIKARLLAIVGLGNRARKKKLEKSILQQDYKKVKQLSNQAIEDAAKDGDQLALALLRFTAKRTADVLKIYIQNSSSKKVDVIYLAGGFANGLYNSDNKHLKELRIYLEKELSKFTKAKLEIHNPELDGAIEYLKLKK